MAISKIINCFSKLGDACDVVNGRRSERTTVLGSSDPGLVAELTAGEIIIVSWQGRGIGEAAYRGVVANRNGSGGYGARPLAGFKKTFDSSGVCATINRCIRASDSATWADKSSAFQSSSCPKQNAARKRCCGKHRVGRPLAVVSN